MILPLKGYAYIRQCWTTAPEVHKLLLMTPFKTLNLISRAAARERGKKRYFTGKPCRHGHLISRLVSSGKCVECELRRTLIRNARPIRRLRGWDPEIERSYKHTRRARMRNAPGKFTLSNIRCLFDQQQGRCRECSIPITLKLCHIDHVIPLARGGSNWPFNLRLTCAGCNLEKNDKTVSEHKALKISSTDHLAAPGGVIVRPPMRKLLIWH